MELGDYIATGAASTRQPLNPGVALWVVVFDAPKLPREQDFEIYRGTAEGPGGYFKGYLDFDPVTGVGKFFSAGANGLINVFDPNKAPLIRKGQTIGYVWSIGTGAPPTVRLWCRQPEETGKVL